MKLDCGTLSHVPALAMKGTNSQTCWICACKIKVETSSYIFALSPFRHSEAAKDWWLVQFPQCFPYSIGISSSWRKPPLFWKQETFSWGHCKYSALTKMNCYLNTQTTTGKSLPVFNHLTFKTFTIHLCYQWGVTTILGLSSCQILVKSMEPVFSPLQQVSPAMGPVNGTDKLTLTPRVAA